MIMWEKGIHIYGIPEVPNNYLNINTNIIKIRI